MNENLNFSDDAPMSPPRRPINYGQIWGTVIFLTVIGCGIWYLINNFRTQSREKHAAEMRQQQTDARVTALALKYNAITNWEASLPDRGGAQPFSIDVATALIRDDVPPWERQSVLIKCNLTDVFEQNGKFFISLSSADALNGLSLELQCNPDQLKVFTSTNGFSSFAVVARCHEVQRLPGDEAGFSVKGELLDALQLSKPNPNEN